MAPAAGLRKALSGAVGIAALAMLLEAAVSTVIVKLQQPIIDDLLVAKQFNWWLPLAMVVLLFGRGLFGLISDYTMARGCLLYTSRCV